MVKNSSDFFGDNDAELFSCFHPNISIVSFRMLAVRPLPLAAPNRILDHSVHFVYVCEVTQMPLLGSLDL